MDYGHQYADKKISAVDRELKKTYRTAQKQLKEKLADFEKQFARKNKEKKKMLDAGEITQDEYRQWMTGQVFVRSRWQEQQRMINAVLLDHNRQAMNIVQNSTFDVFAENYNFNAYLAEQKMVGTFNLYNAEAVARLILGDPQLLPEWDIDKKKDYVWNQQKVNNILRQSIIQGKGIDEITQDLADGLATKNYNRMRLFARTAITEAENAGRQQQMNDAAEMGIEVKKMWIATHDNRTRDAHRELDGEIVPYDQPFHSALGDIQRPGDPTADPANVYNCRCTMQSIYPKYDQGTTREETIDGQSYEEWKKGKKKRGEVAKTGSVVQGKDITGTWERRKDQFDFEIRDVLNAQGFDGLPKVFSQEEFDKAVAESKFVAQRTYSAPDQETLDDYRKQLYDGEFYVECSTGGAQYGQGMYCASDYTGTLTDGIKAEMKHYIDLGERRFSGRTINEMPSETQEKWVSSVIKQKYGEEGLKNKDLRTVIESEVFSGKHGFDAVYDAHRAIRGKYNNFMEAVSEIRQMRSEAKANVETFTLTPDAKIITYDDAVKLRYGYETEFRTSKMTKFLNSLSEEEKYVAARETRTELNGLDPLEIIKKAKEYEKTHSEEEYSRIAEKAYKERDRINDEWWDYGRNLDEGAVAALHGYDAINAVGHGQSGSYTVILNRTKCIFLGGKK